MSNVTIVAVGCGATPVGLGFVSLAGIADRVIGDRAKGEDLMDFYCSAA